METVMEERPKYSTGFRLMVGGWIVAALGLLAAALGAKSIGLVLLLVGGILGIWFKYPTDWRKTWPDDFPILAPAFGREPRPERWARTTNWCPWDFGNRAEPCATCARFDRWTRGSLNEAAVAPMRVWLQGASAKPSARQAVAPSRPARRRRVGPPAR